jgi:hypothetical protein
MLCMCCVVNIHHQQYGQFTLWMWVKILWWQHLKFAHTHYWWWYGVWWVEGKCGNLSGEWEIAVFNFLNMFLCLCWHSNFSPIHSLFANAIAFRFRYLSMHACTVHTLVSSLYLHIRRKSKIETRFRSWIVILWMSFNPLSSVHSTFKKYTP